MRSHESSARSHEISLEVVATATSPQQWWQEWAGCLQAPCRILQLEAAVSLCLMSGPVLDLTSPKSRRSGSGQFLSRSTEIKFFISTCFYMFNLPVWLGFLSSLIHLCACLCTHQLRVFRRSLKNGLQNQLWERKDV